MKQKIKDMWVEAVSSTLSSMNIPTYEIEKLYDTTYTSTSVGINNSYIHNYKLIPSYDFYFKVKENGIMNENGVITVKNYLKTSVLSGIEDMGIEIRQIKKRAKKQATKDGNIMLAENLGKEEQTYKIVINGSYGLFGYAASYMFNIDVADTVTTAGRNIVSVSALTIELIGGGYRHYVIDAHTAMIREVLNSYLDIYNEYTFPEVTVDEVIHHMLGYHYNGYPQLDFLRKYLESIPYEALQVLYIKNNFNAFIRIKEVMNEISMVCNNISNDGNNWVPDIKRPEIKDAMSRLREHCHRLLHGLVNFAGDYLGDLYCPTLVDIVTNLKRRSIVCIDTDSNVSTVFKEQLDLYHFLSETMGDVIDKNPELKRITIPMLAGQMLVFCVEKSLELYGHTIGIDPTLVPKLELEFEQAMEQLQLSSNKKQYAYISDVADMMAHDKRKMKVTGLVFIKSNVNETVSERIEDILYNQIMCHPRELDYKKLVTDINNETANMIAQMQDSNFIRDKKTILKVANEDIALGDYRKKAVLLWNSLFGDSDFIEIPGSFGIIPIKITDGLLEEIKKDVVLYDKWKEYAETIWRYKQCSRAYKAADFLINEEDDEGEDEKEYSNKSQELIMSEGFSRFLPRFTETCKIIVKNWDVNEYYVDFYSLVVKELADADVEYVEYLKKIWGVPKTPFDADTRIVEESKKLAIPIDIVDIPYILKFNNFEMLDYVSSASDFEHLISPMVSSLSVACPRTDNKKDVVTSVLQVF
jgi:hypothetical protein